jgi:hypothetical protein
MRRRYQRDRTLFIADGVRMLVLFVALFCAEYGRYMLLPAMPQAGSPVLFNLLSGMATVQAVTLVGYVAITGWMQMPRSAGATRSESAQATVPVRPQSAKAATGRKRK